MTKLGGTFIACGALTLGFTLGTHAGGMQTTEDKPIQVASVHHVSVFVRSVAKAAEMHTLLLGTALPTFSEPPNPMVFPPDFKGDRSAHPRYGHVVLQNATIEIMEPVGGASPWRDFLDQHGQGIQHLAFAVPNVQEAMARFQKAGGKLLFGGCAGCTAHMDMREQLGYVVELMPAPRPRQ